MHRNTSGMGQHQSSNHCESLKVTKMLFDLVFMAEKERHMGGQGNQGGNKGQHEGGNNQMGEHEGKGYGEQDREGRQHSGESRSRSGSRSGSRGKQGEGKEQDKKHTLKINFHEILNSFEGEDLSVEERYNQLREREDFEHIIKAIKMRVAHQWHRAEEKTGHKEHKVSPFDSYRHAFKKDLMFYQCEADNISEVENPKYGQHEREMLKKWTQKVREHRDEKKMYEDEKHYIGGNGR